VCVVISDPSHVLPVLVRMSASFEFLDTSVLRRPERGTLASNNQHFVQHCTSTYCGRMWYYGALVLVYSSLEPPCIMLLAALFQLLFPLDD
jgi:hypothetical protein